MFFSMIVIKSDLQRVCQDNSLLFSQPFEVDEMEARTMGFKADCNYCQV